MTLERLDLIDEGLARWSRHEISLKEFTDHYWRFSRAEPDGHGPFYAIISQAGHYACRSLIPPPLSYRLGPIILFSLSVAILFGAIRTELNSLASWTTVALLVTMPRLLPEVSFALIDGPLVSLSILAFAFFVYAVRKGSLLWSVAWGLAIGAAMGTKLTGWFLPIPYLAWLVSTLAMGDRTPKGWNLGQVVLGGLSVLTMLWIVNVGWWLDPIAGLSSFFESNLTRRETIPIPILFLGQRYDFSLPWYNTLVWTVVAVPVGTMVLGFVGAGLATARLSSDRFGRLVLFHWLLIMILRSLPQAPGHDGTRQIAVSFVFLTILAGMTIDRLTRAFGSQPLGRFVAPLLAISSVAESASSVMKYHPLELSYYSPIVGGLAGAEKRGFEPTYFWDAMTGEVCDWLKEHTPASNSVLFRNYTPSWRYRFAWHQIPEFYSPGSSPPRWMVLQHRPGQYDDTDRKILASVKPVYQKTFQGVPLISVFDIQDWLTINSKLQAPRIEPSAESPIEEPRP